MSAFVLFIVGAVFLYVLQKKLYEKLWDRGLSISVSFSNKGVFENETVTLVEQVTNDKWLPLPYVRLSYTISQGLVFLHKEANPFAEQRVSFFIIPPKKTMTKKTKVLCKKRGYYCVNYINISSNNIFYEQEQQKIVESNAVLFVYPSEVKRDMPPIFFNQLIGDTTINSFILPDPFQYKGLREYQAFDSFKQINFKAWAKFNEPISNIYATTVSQTVHIILNTNNYSEYVRDEIHEEAIRLTAYYARAYVSLGMSVKLSISEKPTIGKITAPIGLVQIYEELAKLVVPTISQIEISHNNFTTEETVLLISSATDEMICNEFSFLERKGIPSFWIIPRSQKDTDTIPIGKNISTWVIDYD